MRCLQHLKMLVLNEQIESLHQHTQQHMSKMQSHHDGYQLQFHQYVQL